MSSTVPESRRLVIVSETYPPEINGVANTMYQLVSRLRQFGHQVRVVRPRQIGDQPDPSSKDSIPDELLVPGLPIPGYRGLRFGLPVGGRLGRFFAAWRPQAVYIATQGPLGRIALRGARRLKIPTLTGFHTQFHQYSRYYGLGLLMRPIVSSLRRFHNKADATLVPTAALRAELSAIGFRNLRIFTRGVDTDLFSPSRRSDDLRRAWGCAEKTLTVLYVGRIAAEKNIDLALAAFAAIAASGIACRFVLVGDGPERDRLAQRHPDYVFTGARVGEALAAHYASADLFLFPSLTETFGNVVPEAMASGLPVLAFDYAAAREHIRSGVNGASVAVGDHGAFVEAATALAQDREQLAGQGLAARRTAEALGWDSVIRDIERMIIELTDQNTAGENTDATLLATSDRA